MVRWKSFVEGLYAISTHHKILQFCSAFIPQKLATCTRFSCINMIGPASEQVAGNNTQRGRVMSLTTLDATSSVEKCFPEKAEYRI